MNQHGADVYQLHLIFYWQICAKTMKIVCISDTHNQHRQIDVPDGDLLIHAGDFSGHGKPAEISAFNQWLGELPHRHKILIAGNHDFLFEREPALARSLITEAFYLENEFIEIEGLRIYGSPATPWFFNWAFNYHRGPEINAIWDRIPQEIHVLITHGPPFGILDQVAHGKQVGCEMLAQWLESQKSPPALHVFGHIHEAAGRIQTDQTTFINACQLDLRYRPQSNLQVFNL